MRHGSKIDPPNRFETISREDDNDHLEWDTEYLASRQDRAIEYFDDASQSIISENRSPDIPFRYSLNPYRGCIHGCAYCYARPGHEFLGLNAGLDFETKIIVKRDAPRLLRQFLARPRYEVEPISFSGVTDCYQPAERDFRLTRGCLEVALECGQPISIVTKNALAVRDLDLLSALAKRNLVRVYFSVTTLEPKLARDMEPRTSIPSARLRAIRTLTDAGVPVGAMMAPIIPGLNDSEIPAVLQAVSEAGAKVANYVLLRLPLSVETVFEEWVDRTQPLKKTKILQRIRETRGGQSNQTEWQTRMVGTGELADQIRSFFALFKKKFNLDGELPAHDLSQFEPPDPNPDQLRLF